MYALINKHIEKLLDGISKIRHVQPYVDIGRLFSEGNSSSDEFKANYRKFYQLNAARLSEDFCARYFQTLEQNRGSEQLNLFDVVDTLYQFPSNSKGKKAVHFSFATKLVHTVDQNSPIYDSMVAAFYFFPEIKPGWSKATKIAEYRRQYQFLEKEYKRILDDELLSTSIVAFRKRFQLDELYSDCKVIDTLLWRYTAYLKGGAIRDEQVQYD
jgi:hypothetical protein